MTRTVREADHIVATIEVYRLRNHKKLRWRIWENCKAEADFDGCSCSAPMLLCAKLCADQ